MPSYEERILKAIENSKVGLTTMDVARRSGVSKTTAIKYLSVLKSEGKCEFAEVGPSKLWRSCKPKNEKLGEFGIDQIELKSGTDNVIPLPLSFIAQLKDVSDDVTISMSFKVEPEKFETFMNLIKKYSQQKDP